MCILYMLHYMCTLNFHHQSMSIIAIDCNKICIYTCCNNSLRYISNRYATDHTHSSTCNIPGFVPAGSRAGFVSSKCRRIIAAWAVLLAGGASFSSKYSAIGGCCGVGSLRKKFVKLCCPGFCCVKKKVSNS